MQGIYIIRNLINNKIYIGSSVDFIRRFASHKSELLRNKHHCTHLQNAWNKYGEDNFKFEIVELIENREMLLPREQWWIDSLKDHVYNLSLNAKSPMLGKHLSESRKKEISMALIGNKSRTGMKNSRETRRKISLALKGKETWSKGKKLSDETKKKMSLVRKGKKHTKTWSRNIRKSLIKRKLLLGENYFSKETRLKMRNSKLGKKLSLLHRLKISISNKIVWKLRKEKLVK